MFLFDILIFFKVIVFLILLLFVALHLILLLTFIFGLVVTLLVFVSLYLVIIFCRESFDSLDIIRLMIGLVCHVRHHLDGLLLLLISFRLIAAVAAHGLVSHEFLLLVNVMFKIVRGIIKLVVATIGLLLKASLLALMPINTLFSLRGDLVVLIAPLVFLVINGAIFVIVVADQDSDRMGSVGRTAVSNVFVFIIHHYGGS